MNNEVYEQALRFLNQRFLSRMELFQKLQKKGFEITDIETVIGKLEELSYIDDERLSEQVTRFFMSEQKYGSLYIKQKMKQRGLTASINLDNYDELRAALVTIKKKMRSSKVISREKLYRFLMQRGFSHHVILSSVNQALSEINEYE